MKRKLLAEFTGTFALVFCGTGAIVAGQVFGAPDHTGVSLVFGLVVMILIYAFGGISGAHFNPAVSLAFYLGRKFPLKELGLYLCCQVLGALAASLLVRLLFGPGNLGATLPSGTVSQSLILETILTFLLVLVILRVSGKAKEVGLMAGVAIGGTVGLEALLGGPVSGASMNPARSFGPALVSGHWEHLWIYLVAPGAGAIVAVVLENLLKEENTE